MQDKNREIGLVTTGVKTLGHTQGGVLVGYYFTHELWYMNAGMQNNLLACGWLPHSRGMCLLWRIVNKITTTGGLSQTTIPHTPLTD